MRHETHSMAGEEQRQPVRRPLSQKKPPTPNPGLSPKRCPRLGTQIGSFELWDGEVLTTSRVQLSVMIRFSPAFSSASRVSTISARSPLTVSSACNRLFASSSVARVGLKSFGMPSARVRTRSLPQCTAISAFCEPAPDLWLKLPQPSAAVNADWKKELAVDRSTAIGGG